MPLEKQKNDFLKILNFFIFPACVFFVSLVFSLFLLYDSFEFLDIPLHFVGGFAVSYTAVLFLNYFSERNWLKIKGGFLFVLFVVFLVMLVAVLWEFYEFLLGSFFDVVVQPSVEDTVLDFFMGFLGALVGGLVFRKIV